MPCGKRAVSLPGNQGGVCSPPAVSYGHCLRNGSRILVCLGGVDHDALVWITLEYVAFWWSRDVAIEHYVSPRSSQKDGYCTRDKIFLCHVLYFCTTYLKTSTVRDRRAFPDFEHYDLQLLKV